MHSCAIAVLFFMWRVEIQAIPLALPCPNLKNPGQTEDRSGVGGELIEVCHDAFNLLRGSKPLLYDRFLDVFHRDCRHVLSGSTPKSWLHNFQMHIVEAGVEEQAHQPRPDVRIAAFAVHGSLVQVHIAAEGRTRRITEMGGKLDIFDDHRAASPRGSRHARKSLLWFRKVCEQKTTVYKVVDIDFSKVGDIRGPKNRRQLVMGCLVASELQTTLVPIYADGLSRWSDAKSEPEGDGPVAAADIETAHPLVDADAAKKGFGCRPLGTCQEP